MNVEFDPHQGCAGRWRWLDTVTLIVCMFVGVTLSLLPHLISQSRYGDPFWAADYDEVGAYSPVIADAYFNHPWKICDPVRLGDHPGIYDRMQFVPFVLTARLLHLGPQRVAMLMRLFGGLTIPAATFLVFRRLIRDPWLAGIITLLAVCDSGSAAGAPAIKMLQDALSLARGTSEKLLASYPTLQSQWRVINPSATRGWLLLSLWLLMRLHERPMRGRILLAGAGVGLLFYVLVFYWTAALVGLSLLVLFCRKNWRAYVACVAIGVIIGLPSIWTTLRAAHVANPDWQLRAEKPIHIGHFQEVQVSKQTALMLVMALIWLGRRRSMRQAAPVFAFALAGFVLCDHQVVTGLQLENFHWQYVAGLCGMMLGYAMLADLLQHVRLSRRMLAALASIAALWFGMAIWLRYVEAIRTHDSVVMTAQYYEFQRELAGGWDESSRGIIAGDPAVVDWAVLLENQRPLNGYMVLESPTLSNDEWRHRIALNEFLRGKSFDEYEQVRKRELSGGWGPWSRHPEMLQEEMVAVGRAWNDVTSNPRRWCREYGVERVALPAEGHLASAIAKSASVERSSGHWTIWRLNSPIN